MLFVTSQRDISFQSVCFSLQCSNQRTCVIFCACVSYCFLFRSLHGENYRTDFPTNYYILMFVASFAGLPEDCTCVVVAVRGLDVVEV